MLVGCAGIDSEVSSQSQVMERSRTEKRDEKAAVLR